MIGDSAPWPVPRPSWRARRYCLTKFPDKTVPYGDGTLEMAYDRSNAPSFARRVRRLRDGKRLTLDLLVDGSLPWCPPFTSGHPVRLTAGSACTGGGGGPSTERPVPLDTLRVADAELLDPLTRPIVPGLETWTLTVEQPESRASVTGLLTDLVLLAYAAGWAAPAAYLGHTHAGAAGVDLGPSPRRPPIRPLGWVLMALGVALVAAIVVALALAGGHGRVAGIGACAAALILSGYQLRRRKKTQQAETARAPSSET